MTENAEVREAAKATNNEAESCPSCAKHTAREEADKKKMIVRLKKIEGQIRGIEKMVEQDAYCPDILIQVSAASCALSSFNKVLLSNHIHGCVKHDILAGDDASIDELCRVLEKVMR